MNTPSTNHDGATPQQPQLRNSDAESKQKKAYFLRWARGEISFGNEARKSLAQAFDGSSVEAIHKLRWIENDITQIVSAQICEQVVSMLEPADESKAITIEDALKIIETNIQTWSPERSTNPYGNLLNEQKLIAMKRVRERLR